MSNKLVFRTPIGGITIPDLTTQNLGVVDMSKFDRIRVAAVQVPAVGTNVEVILRITGTPQVGGADVVLDVLPLAPHGQVTRVYDVVCTELTVFAVALSGPVTLDVLLYGFQSR